MGKGNGQPTVCFVQGTMFKPGQSQASESVQTQEARQCAHTADSSGSNAFKRARTVSSALLDLLPLASDASTVDALGASSECSAHDIMRLHETVAAYVQDQMYPVIRHDKGFHLGECFCVEGASQYRQALWMMEGVARDCALPAMLWGFEAGQCVCRAQEADLSEVAVWQR